MNNILGKVGFEPTIAFANRFTVCHLKPLSHFPKISTYSIRESNPSFRRERAMCYPIH